MIPISRDIVLDEREIEESFVRASGPGGQNVNKLSTAVQLRFNGRHSPSLPEDVRARLERLAGSRVTRATAASKARSAAPVSSRCAAPGRRSTEGYSEALAQFARRDAELPLERAP